MNHDASGLFHTRKFLQVLLLDKLQVPGLFVHTIFENVIPSFLILSIRSCRTFIILLLPLTRS